MAALIHAGWAGIVAVTAGPVALVCRLGCSEEARCYRCGLSNCSRRRC